MSALTLILAILGTLTGVAVGWAWGRAQGASSGAAQAAAATATLDAERRLTVERLEQMNRDQERLVAEFEALAGRVLRTTKEDFLQLATQRWQQAEQSNAAELAKREKAVEQLVAPLRDTLGKVENQLTDLETRRARAEAELSEQVRQMLTNNEKLRSETSSLVNALRAPQTRGRWGELQLQRIVELSGMSPRVDFDEQVSTTGDDRLRPDMVVRLAGGKQVVVDSKVSLAAYLEAHESTDPAHAEQRLQAHAKHLRKHVNDLAGKGYWSQFSPAPEFVVLFVPGEAFLAPALERDPLLLEEAMAKKVIIATPTTLMSMLRTIAYAWQQEALAHKAQQVFDLGRELYERLGKMGEHVTKLGRSITRVTEDYNKAVGSLERRVLVTARKLNEMDVVDGELAPLEPLHGDRPQALTAAELVDDTELEIRLLPTRDAELDTVEPDPTADAVAEDQRYGLFPTPPSRPESATG
jgi:DNA recombination protein RmuC